MDGAEGPDARDEFVLSLSDASIKTSIRCFDLRRLSDAPIKRLSDASIKRLSDASIRRLSSDAPIKRLSAYTHDSAKWGQS